MIGTAWIRIGAIVGGLAVIAGAFGAHYLKQTLRLEEARLATFETGARYQMVHALALLVVGLLATSGRGSSTLPVAGWCFLGGVILFSGSLYLLSLSIGPTKLLGPITPLGGLLLIVGWFVLAVSVRSGT